MKAQIRNLISQNVENENVIKELKTMNAQFEREVSNLKKRSEELTDTADKIRLEKEKYEEHANDIRNRLNEQTADSRKLREIGRNWKKKADDLEVETKQKDKIITMLEQKYESQAHELKTLKLLDFEAQKKLIDEKEALKKEVSDHKEKLHIIEAIMVYFNISQCESIFYKFLNCF